jgi:GT2 family glycosyltransferase
MDVSIIIVNYNTNILLKQCIASIYQHTKDICFEIIVIDNASQDGSAEMIKYEYPNVILIESKENLGFGNANNLGAKKASGDFIFLLNSDTILLENSLKILYEYYEKMGDPNIAVVGCRLLDINRKPQISFGNFPSIWQELFEFGPIIFFRKFYNENLGPALAGEGSGIKEVDYISGADMFFKKAIFDKIGGFDEDFFMYYEDTELCFRLKRIGYKIIWYPYTSIIHYAGASGQKSKDADYVTLEIYHRSKYLYFRKFHGRLIANVIKYLTIPKILFIYRKFDTKRILKILLNV